MNVGEPIMYIMYLIFCVFYFRAPKKSHIVISFNLSAPCNSPDQEVQYLIKDIRTVTFLFQESQQTQYLRSYVLSHWFPKANSKESITVIPSKNTTESIEHINLKCERSFQPNDTGIVSING